ncbi:MAG: nitroreductase family deazaflavin-dependent oxidoreductase [Rubrobacter sp.]
MTARGRPYGRTAATTQKWATKLHTTLFRATAGRVGGRMVGSPVLLLNAKGRKTGHRRTTPLLYLRDGDSYVTVASNGGTSDHPVWWLNLKANPEATVEFGDHEVRVRAEEASREDRARLWPRLVEMYPSYDDYQRKTDRQIPVIVLYPVD